MIRKKFKKRENYADRLDQIGFRYHRVLSPDREEYWREGVAYEFTLQEIEEIESVSAELHAMCLETVGEIIESGDYPAEYKLTDEAKSLAENSWNKEDWHIYGRFDLLFETTGKIKLYEYNADTPTALLEASVAQWQWLEEAENVPHRDQFNSIHEKLIARWNEFKPSASAPMLYLFAANNAWYEDWGNLEYMADTAMQGGWEVYIDDMENIGYDTEEKTFVNAQGNLIDFAFKLYPWEWMMSEHFGKHINSSPTVWFEPAWKMLLSNKALLPVLWQRYPNHPNLLPSFFADEKPHEDFERMLIKKPILGREGANIHLAGRYLDKLMDGSRFAEDYHAEGYIYQEYAPLPNFEGFHPVIGSWMIGDEPAGIGIREDKTFVTGNGSHFVPHYFIN